MICDGHLGTGAAFGEDISAVKTKEGWKFILIGSPDYQAQVKSCILGIGTITRFDTKYPY